MENDLLKKTKKRRIRIIAVVVVVALFAVSAVWGMTIKKANDAQKAKAKTETTQAENNASKSDSSSKATKKKSTSSSKTAKKDSSTSTSAAKKSSSSSSSSAATKKTSKKYVTIEIRCDELSNNMSKLENESIRGYIPSSGVILSKTKYYYSSGDTVFDALENICQKKGIQMEHKYTPAWGTEYVEGINHLYEFDAGNASGWLVKANGEKLKRGASAVKLHNKDRIFWYYTVDYTKD